MKKSSSKSEQIELLSDFVLVEASIACSKCENETYLADYDSEEHAYKKGWRVKDAECYCPKCAKEL